MLPNWHTNYQRLLLDSAQNGRLQRQQNRTETRPAVGNPTHRQREGWQSRFQPRAATNAARPTQLLSSGASSRTFPRPLASAAPRLAPVAPAGWSSRTSAVVIIRGVPAQATPWTIKQFFEKYGSVVYVELDEASRGGSRSARIRFEPPPTDAAFLLRADCRLTVGGSASWVRVEVPTQPPEENSLASPLGNPCPAALGITPPKFVFGLLTQPTTFMRKKEVQSLVGGLELKFTVDFRRKRFVIHFPLRVCHERQYYRADIKFGIVRSIHRMDADGGRSALVLSVDDAPLFRKKQSEADGALWADRLVWGEDELWHRVVEIRPSSENPRSEPVSVDEQHGTVDLGRCTTYWIDLDRASAERWSVAELQLRDWNINTNLGVDFSQVPDKRAELWDILADPSPGLLSTGANPSSNNDLALLSAMAHVSLPFDVRYQLEVCLSRGVLCEYNLGRDFIGKLLELSNPGGLGANQARLILEYAADQGRRIYEPMDLFEDRAALSYCPTTLHIPDYCALVRKVTVTPTRIYFNTPTVETTNRVIRRYKEVQHHFIRVQFTDELLEGRIRACDVGRDDELYTRVYRTMLQGIRMGSWHWKFLAFGNSQIRENGAFFFCQPEGDRNHPVSCDSIRQWMGKFNHISSVAKLAARLGQCFSTTRLLHCVSSPRIVKMPDVEKGGFCFTDGVGKISPLLALFVSEDWQIQPPPSAFQFRMGGCKGVLVTWPEAKGTEVRIRPSQEKFYAEYNGLEIIRCSHFSSATLNRQTIMILSCLGVPDDVFTEMMKEQLSSYDAAITNKDKAVELLSSYVDENMTTPVMAKMLMDGFMHTREPFVRTLLQLWRSWSIKALKEKARLVVDKGAFVLGCVDETGTLRGHSKATEGRRKISQDQLPQIFLQVPDPSERGTYRAITGLCVVGRNPSLHPGDIRVVEAVDVPQLRHLRDVVVFPLHGDRDVPSMCSGGDLDGDDFFVFWDPKLLPAEWSHPPMNYAAPKPLTEPRAATAKSLATFFVLYMKNDRLPLIAHAHLATADREPEGAKHRKCLELAALHSTAVDYVKTGIPAAWDKKLDPRRYPHFMEKAKSRSYHSTRVLGKLYDLVNKDVFDNRDNYKLPFDARILKRFELSNSLLKEARKIKSQYDIAMRRIMGQLEIRTEFEVWTTFVMSKPRVGTDYKVQEKVGREAAGLKKQFRDLCVKAAGGRDLDALGPLVAAMYRVTWEEVRIALYEARQPHVLPDGTVGLRRVTARSMPLISFPWLFPAELGRIAAGAEKQARVVDVGADEIPRKGPKLKGGRGRVDVQQSADSASVEEELDWAAMDYTRTSDGQFIHRGEILHLFRHDDDEEGGFYYIDDAAVSESPVTPEPERASEGESQGPSGRVDAPSPSKTSEQDRDLAVLLDLESSSGDDEEASSSTGSDLGAPSQATSGSVDDDATAAAAAAAAAGGAAPDLLSSDDNTDPGLNSSPCLTPVKNTARDRSASAAEESSPTPPRRSSSESAKEQPAANNGGSKAGAAADDDDDDEVEYEEEIVEVEAETALERAARLA